MQVMFFMRDIRTRTDFDSMKSAVAQRRRAARNGPVPARCRRRNRRGQPVNRVGNDYSQYFEVTYTRCAYYMQPAGRLSRPPIAISGASSRNVGVEGQFMVRQYFGTDGIRGRANGVDHAGACAQGRAGRRADVPERRSPPPRVIGKDTRLSGYMIETALVAGFTSVGMDVLLTGPMPTPAVAMLTRSMRADLGVMISASHNPLRRQRHQAVRARTATSSPTRSSARSRR